MQIAPSNDRTGRVRIAGAGEIDFQPRIHHGIDVYEWGGAAIARTNGEGKPMGETRFGSVGPFGVDQSAPGWASFTINYLASVT